MRHLTAAQKGVDGGWHYVSLSREGGHPIGHCAEHEPHATETEARECYNQYRRDNVVLDVQFSHWADCAADECGAPTKTGARVQYDGFDLAALCTTHLTVEDAVKAMHLAGAAGDAWVS